MTSPSNAPTREIGYAQAYMTSASGGTNSNWWMFEDETTPELRWPQSVYVYDQMRRQDAQVASVLRAVSLPVRRTPWRIDPAGARPEVVQLVAEDLGMPIVGNEVKPLPRARDRFSWLEHLREALLMLPFGHMYFEQNVRIVNGQARLRKLAARMPKTIEEIDVARDGGLVSITQYANGGGGDRQPPIPVNRLVAYVHDREAGNWLGSSLLRPAYKHWLIKDRLLRVQAQTIERNGMGIPVYEAAETERAADMATGLALATSLRSGDAAGARIPFGAKLKLMGVEGTLPDAQPAIDYHDSQIARAVLAHFLNLGTQTGSWALGSTFADFFTLSLQTLAQQIADVATQHVVEDIVDWNWGEDEPAPRIVFDEIGSRQAATAEAIKSLIDAGVITPDEVLEGAVRQQFGLPPRDEATERVPEQPATPAPGSRPETGPDERPGSVAAMAADVDDVDDEPVAVIAHRPGGKEHDQSSHGRKGRQAAPTVDAPAVADPEPARPRRARKQDRPQAAPAVLDDEDGKQVTAHSPGGVGHDQSRHGRRFRTPGDPSSGLRPNRAEREAAQSAQELDELRQSLARAAAAFQARSDRQAGAKSTSAPSRMTKAGYTKILKAEQVRLLMLDGKSEKEAKALTRPTMSIDDLKARNTEMRKALRRKGVDYRTEEQKRADDAEKNALLDEVERLAAEGGHDPAAKRAGASRMSKQELAKFVADVKDYQRRQKAKREAPSTAAFEQVEADTRATPRQVGYIVSLLRERAKSGEGGGFMSGPTDSAEIRKMSKREASAYINSLRGDY